MTSILILYYSRNGSTAAMAHAIARGVDSVAGAEAVLRTVPKVSAVCAQSEDTIPEQGPPYATLADLKQCDGLALGSPTHFGNMSASLKHFIDSTSELWFSGALVGKPAGVFTSTGGLHSGQESTLLTMMMPLLHHGMIILGLPSTSANLKDTTTGGTPYGPSHLATHGSLLSAHEKALCFEFGVRLASTAQRLKQSSC